MIDLHLHTTASDGRCTPDALVALAAAAGVTVMAVTDHDTTAGIADARRAAAVHGIEVVNGIEITSVHNGVDVHMLGYFFAIDDPQLSLFLAGQRDQRLRRVESIASRLAALGLPIDVAPIVRAAKALTGRSVGRPHVARALVAAGHVADVRDAFDRWLGQGCPAYVERTGAPPSDIVEIVHAAGGIVSMAHPGRTKLDELIEPLKQSGLDAIEVYHSDHDAAAIQRYGALAARLDLLATGGSDFHGDPSHGLSPGAIALPPQEWARLSAARSAR
jgi:predicted metal-dependent phosphoesterase TrpH